MCWKKMQYWLIGGIIGAIIALIYDIRGLVLYGIQDSMVFWFLSLVMDLLIVFAIGAFIGFIIGAIIKRRREKHSKKVIRRKKK